MEAEPFLCRWTDKTKIIITIQNFVDVSTKCMNETESQDLSSGRRNHVEFHGQIFEKYIIFHENLPNGSRVFPCSWTNTTKIIITIQNFVDVPTKYLNKTESQDLSSVR
jgi:hypothetical protein